MKKEDSKVGFDLSVLTYEELISVYTKINEFLSYLESQKINLEPKEKFNE